MSPLANDEAHSAFGFRSGSVTVQAFFLKLRSQPSCLAVTERTERSPYQVY